MDQQHKKFFKWSLLLHVIVLLVLIVSFDFTSTMPVAANAKKNTDVITATVMSQPAVLTARPRPIEPQPVIPKPPVPPQPVIPVIKPKPQEVVVEQKKIIIPDKSKQQKKLQQELIEKQLLADLQRQKQVHKKQKQQLKQKSVEAAFEKELKELNSKSIQQQMKQEQQRLSSEREQQAQGIVDKYKALVLQAISQQWLLPPNVNKKLFAELLIRVAPGGVVMDVQLTRSSGDVNLDRSARAAVFKASPLPVPKDADAFERFRQFTLKVKPENVSSG